MGWTIKSVERVLRTEDGTSNEASGVSSSNTFVVSKPTPTGEQPDGLQKPKAPMLTPLTLASGMPLMMGVESTAIINRPKAVSSSTESGVAGRSIAVEAGRGTEAKSSWLTLPKRKRSQRLVQGRGVGRETKLGRKGAESRWSTTSGQNKVMYRRSTAGRPVGIGRKSDYGRGIRVGRQRRVDESWKGGR